MAIYHASFQIIGRSAGRSACAAAAYRSGERVLDHTTGEVHFYAAKQAQSVSDTFILAPDHAPAWATDRSELWSTVETVEKRNDAQLARELNVAIPRELSRADQTALITHYVQSQFVDRGMIADVALHDLDSDNPHAHVMLTMRSIEGDSFGNKNRDWNRKDLLAEWREAWGDHANRALEKAGVEARIDHRSLKDQGIEQIPTIHLGVHAHGMEKRGVKTERGNVNRAIKAANRELRLLGQQLVELGARVKQTVHDVRQAMIDGFQRGMESGSVTAYAGVSTSGVPPAGMPPARQSSTGKSAERMVSESAPPGASSSSGPDTSRGRALLERLKAEKEAREDAEKQEQLERERIEKEKEQEAENAKQEKQDKQRSLNRGPDNDRGMGR